MTDEKQPSLSPDHWHANPILRGMPRCKGICPRHVPPSMAYCCAACRVQSEAGNEPGVLAAGDHPMLSHSEGCDQRDQERRPDAWTPGSKAGSPAANFAPMGED